MENEGVTANINIVYPALELLDEATHYSNVDLVREINKLKKQLYDIAQSR